MLCKLIITFSIATAMSLSFSGQQADAEHEVKWLEATTFELPEALTSPDPAIGAMGSSVKAFRIGKQSAAMIVDRLDRKGIGVFMSICEPRARDANELRLEFITHDGEQHEVTSDGSVGGWCLIFQAPQGVPSDTLKEFRVLYDARAEWTK